MRNHHIYVADEYWTFEVRVIKANVFYQLDYVKFSAIVGQEEGIKIKIKFPKHVTGEKKMKFS